MKMPESQGALEVDDSQFKAADDGCGGRIVAVPYKGILFGFEWATDWHPYPLHVSIRIPFVSFDIGIGKRRGAFV